MEEVNQDEIERIIENYILKQSDTANPNILFIPTASAEDKSYIVNFG